MNNFIFQNATKTYFGQGCVKEYLACLVKNSHTVMLAYGGGSIKRSGIYDEVVGILAAAGKTVVEFPGIMSNPTYAKVQEGAALAKESGVDMILGIGGGSVMDCCKAISMAAVYRRCRMKLDEWSKPDPLENFFSLPNQIYALGLEAGEIAVYGYLRSLKSRETYQCWPSYKTIGKAVGMSKNTVKKYVAGLEEKRLISAEPTTVQTKSGKRNGNLRYTILPIQEAVDYFHEQQLARLELDVERQRLTKYDRVARQEPLCAALPRMAGTDTDMSCEGEFRAVPEDYAGDKMGPPAKPSAAVSLGRGGTAE